MYKYIRNLSYFEYLNIVRVTMIVLATLGVVLFWINTSTIEQKYVEAEQERLEVLAVSGAKTIEGMLSMFKVNLIAVAEEVIIDVAALKDEIVVSNTPIIKQFVMTNMAGTLTSVINKEGVETGKGLEKVDQSILSWAKQANKGEVYLSKPVIDKVGINSGQWVLIMATPVFKSNIFNGVLYTSIRLEDLRKYYVDSLNIKSPTAIYVVDKNGMAVSSQFTPLLGIDVRQYANSKKWEGYETYLSMISSLSKEVNGKNVYYFMGSDNKVVKWVNSYAPAKINGDFLMVAAAYPYSEVLKKIDTFFMYQVVYLSFLIAAIVVIAFFWIVGLKVARHQGINDGLKIGRKFNK